MSGISKRILSGLAVIVTLSLAACDSSRIYETNVDLSEDAWSIEDSLSFNFEIKDPSKKYNILYNIRYTEDYPFYNLYISHSLTDSLGQKIPTTPQPQNMDLFRPTTGAPYGSGISDNYDHRILVLQDFQFPHKGKYHMHVHQFMRENPLRGVRSFGICVEEAQE
ncbi:gliding motility lipoprotein GldH [Cytophagaceae bacterium ABcell3]|nr:gliding motility lipoprotein GldH [Cytophagaceae bacterium ABcell3]